MTSETLSKVEASSLRSRRCMRSNELGMTRLLDVEPVEIPPAFIFSRRLIARLKLPVREAKLIIRGDKRTCLWPGY